MNKHRTPLLFIFFLTGVSALIYQVAWVRQATLVFGVSVYAYAVVLSAFMGGLALGSYWLGRKADVVKQPLRLFAVMQLGIAAFGFVSPFLLTGLMPLYGNLARTLPLGSGMLTAIRAVASIVVLVPPTLLMGAALPVMARVLAKRSDYVGSDVGRLYAYDTLGAAFGCGLTGIWLLRTIGTRETIFVAAALNVAVALLAWWRSGHASTRQVSASSEQNRQPHASDQLAFTARFVLWSYAISGLVAIGHEIVWARILAIYTLDAVFSFSIMLTTFLFGLTVGGMIGVRRLNRQRSLKKSVRLGQYVDLQMWLGLTAMGTLYVFSRLSRVNLEDLFGDSTLRNILFYEFLLGFLTILVPTIFLGMLFPLVISLVTQDQPYNIGTLVGRISGLNTAGGVIGSLVVSFAIIPVIGLQGTGAMLASISLIIGLVASWVARAQGETSSLLPHAGMAAGIALVLVLPDGHYLGFRDNPSDRMVFYEEGVETTVAVFDVPEDNFKVSFVNGRIEVPTDPVSMAAFRLLGHLPPILAPHADSALMLSFGNGIATGSLETHGVDQIDAVDLSAQQFKAAELYWQENHNVLRSPRLQTFVEDGRNFLLQTPRRYDIITTDATHPVNTSSWALFTKEFYESVADRLEKDGVFLQWLPFHNLTESDYKTILRTFQSVFPHATLWYTGGSHTLLLATPDELTGDSLLTYLQAVENPQVAKELETPTQINRFVAMFEDELRAYSGTGELVTDNNAYFLPRDQDNLRLLRFMQNAVANKP